MITSVIILLIVAAVFYFIYMMAGKAINGIPLAVVGIILLLVFLLAALQLFGVYRVVG